MLSRGSGFLGVGSEGFEICKECIGRTTTFGCSKVDSVESRTVIISFERGCSF